MSVPIGRNTRTDNILQKSSNVAEYNITQMTNICQWDISWWVWNDSKYSRQKHTQDMAT